MVEKQELNKLKILFLGSPEFAANILEILVDCNKYHLLGVITQPDKPGKRGKKLQIPDVKKSAQNKELSVYQPQDINSDQAVETIKHLNPDILIVAAYGQIISERILNIPPLGAWNVHASLLPKYRGAAPIQHALLNGEKATGITIMQMAPQMDSGAILLQKAMAIDVNDDCKTLHDQLAKIGGESLIQALQKMQDNKLLTINQDSELATFAPKLKKNDRFINWNKQAKEIHNQIRALHPSPGAIYEWGDKNLKIYPGRVGQRLNPAVAPGTFLGLMEQYLSIACQDREYLIPTVKPSSSKELTAKEFFNGYLKK